jgi:hypothetical protein
LVTIIVQSHEQSNGGKERASSACDFRLGLAGKAAKAGFAGVSNGSGNE